jgi:hypothetical protein
MVWQEVELEKGTVLRTFGDNIDPTELKWHRDDEDRTVVAISTSDWQIQLENKLPVSLDNPIFIERGEWHRLIKGNGELRVKIIKSNG